MLKFAAIYNHDLTQKLIDDNLLNRPIKPDDLDYLVKLEGEARQRRDDIVSFSNDITLCMAVALDHRASGLFDAESAASLSFKLNELMIELGDLNYVLDEIESIRRRHTKPDGQAKKAS